MKKIKFWNRSLKNNNKIVEQKLFCISSNYKKTPIINSIKNALFINCEAKIPQKLLKILNCLYFFKKK